MFVLHILRCWWLSIAPRGRFEGQSINKELRELCYLDMIFDYFTYALHVFTYLDELQIVFHHPGWDSPHQGLHAFVIFVYPCCQVSSAKYMIFINGQMTWRKHQVASFFVWRYDWHQVSLLALRGQESDLVGCAGGVLVCWFLAWANWTLGEYETCEKHVLERVDDLKMLEDMELCILGEEKVKPFFKNYGRYQSPRKIYPWEHSRASFILIRDCSLDLDHTRTLIKCLYFLDKMLFFFFVSPCIKKPQ